MKKNDVNIKNRSTKIDNSRYTRQHISTKVYGSYLYYIKNNYKNIDISKLCLDSGLPLEYLLNPINWVSAEFDAEFTKNCLELTGQNDLCYKVGTKALVPEIFPIYYPVKYTFKCREVYAVISYFSKIYNNTLDVKTINTDANTTRFNFTLSKSSLTELEVEKTRENIRNIIDNTMGTLAAVPTIFGLPLAQVNLLSTNESAQDFVFELTCKYQEANRFRRVILQASMLGTLVVIVFMFCTRYLGLGNSTSFIFSSFLAIFYLLKISFVYYKGLKASATTSLKYSEQLDSRYKELQIANEILDKKLREATFNAMVIESLVKANNEEEIYAFTSKAIIDILKYDRCLILKSNQEKSKLRYQTAIGFSKEVLAVLKVTEFEINIESNDPNKIANIYRQRKAILIEDVFKHINTLNPESRKVLLLTQSISFMAVPIASDDHAHGVICIDNFKNEQFLSQNELQVITQVSKQMALSIEKEKSKQIAIESLKSSDKLKSEFLATTTHELKTPLHAILAFISGVLRGESGELNDLQKSDLNLAHKSAQRLERLVSRILSFATKGIQSKSILLKTFDLNSTIQSACESVKSLCTAKLINFRLELQSLEFYSYGDPDSIFEIMVNLLGNAIKFTPDQGEIVVRTTLEDRQVLVSVSDTGIGIPSEQKDKIFDQFYQVNGSSDRTQGGTGLGLAIVKELIGLHHSKIFVDSEVGKGSRFYFKLPLTEEPIETNQGSSVSLLLSKSEHVITDQRGGRDPNHVESEKVQIDRKDLSRIHVMAVDDDPINLKIIEKFLGDRYDLTTSISGIEALSKLKDGLEPDLILLDVMMPGLDGFETCREIRKSHELYKLPIIFLTAKNQTEDLIRGFEAGGNDYLSKPFVKEELLARMSAYIRSSSNSRAFLKFVPWDMIKLMGLKSVFEVELNQSIEVDLNIVFSDMRNFTKFCENTALKEAFKILSAYYARLTPIVAEKNGWVNNIIGDCIMGCHPIHVEDSLQFGFSLFQELKRFYKECESKGLPQFEFAVVISSGPVEIGWMGNKDRVINMALGNTTNTAARIEKLAKQLNCSMVISEETFNRIQNKSSYCLRSLGRHKMKGKLSLPNLYEEFSFDDELVRQKKKDTLSQFNDAVNEFELNNYEAAISKFQRVLEINPNDLVAKSFIPYLLQLEKVKEAGVYD